MSRSRIASLPATLARAGAVLMLAVFCFNLLGDSLRDLVDPRRRT